MPDELRAELAWFDWTSGVTFATPSGGQSSLERATTPIEPLLQCHGALAASYWASRQRRNDAALHRDWRRCFVFSAGCNQVNRWRSACRRALPTVDGAASLQGVRVAEEREEKDRMRIESNEWGGEEFAL